MIRRPKRIAIVCHPWDNLTARSDHSVTIAAYQLARSLPQNWRSTLYGRRWPGQKRRETDSDTIEFKRFTVLRRPHALLEILAGIASCYTGRRINLFLSCTYHICYALRVALSIKLSKCEVVLVLDFLQFVSVIKLFNQSAIICLRMNSRWLTYYATETIERRLCDVDLIIACSDYATKEIRSRFPALATRCHTVYNGVDPHLFCPPGDSSATGRIQELLYVGRLSPEKGVHVLIQAFKILAASRPTLRLRLVGAPATMPYLTLCPDRGDPAITSLKVFYGNRLSDMIQRQLSGRYRSYLEDLIILAAGDERILFHGRVPYRETINFYHSADVLVFSSVCNETFGMPPIEAMACGLPVVATHSGGVCETVENGCTGLLVSRADARELAEAIGHLLDNPTRARVMGRAGRQRVVERFTWDASARRLVDLIESIPCTALRRRDRSRGKSSPDVRN